MPLKAGHCSKIAHLLDNSLFEIIRRITTITKIIGHCIDVFKIKIPDYSKIEIKIE